MHSSELGILKHRSPCNRIYSHLHSLFDSHCTILHKKKNNHKNTRRCSLFHNQ